MSDFVRFGADGLAPVVVQDAATGDVLMLAFMNEEALRRTRETGRAHYWSRSRKALWRKGETSGHEQVVAEIRVNCEENSLLLLVRQIGAVCHTGYPTCYFRSLEPDGTRTVVRERAFDPAMVYGRGASGRVAAEAVEIDPLAEATRLQFGAYAFLRDHELEAVSGTSRLLHDDEAPISSRIADELRELAGVLTGEHGHGDPRSDQRLEASQVLYWVLLMALRHGVTWSALRPDRALATVTDGVSATTVGKLLRAEADRWSGCSPETEDVAAVAHATLALVGQACRSGGVDPLEVVEMDLEELRSRPYLAPYFGESAGYSGVPTARSEASRLPGQSPDPRPEIPPASE
jgi:phosphoribosyl-AMP cyclohydrolase